MPLPQRPVSPNPALGPASRSSGLCGRSGSGRGTVWPGGELARAGASAGLPPGGCRPVNIAMNCAVSPEFME